MKNIDLTQVQEVTEFEKLTAGGYVCGITNADDVPEKEYLKIEYDIAEGKFKNYYRQLNEAKQFWGGRLIRSYKEAALPFFKGFITSVEKSNPNYKWNSEESTLKRKLVGLVLSEEEYIGNDGSLKTRLYVSDVRSVDSIRKGDFEVKPLKKLTGSAVSNNAFAPVSDANEDLPF